MPTRTVEVTNSLGMHARAAARFVHTATEYQARISVACGGRTVDGKSIMELLLLAATQGSTLTIGAVGDDALAALERLSALVMGGFSEDACNE